MSAFTDRLKQNFRRGNGLSEQTRPIPVPPDLPEPKEPSPQEVYRKVIGPWAAGAPKLFIRVLDELIATADETCSAHLRNEQPLAASHAKGVEDAFKQFKQMFNDWSGTSHSAPAGE